MAMGNVFSHLQTLQVNGEIRRERDQVELFVSAAEHLQCSQLTTVMSGSKYQIHIILSHISVTIYIFIALTLLNVYIAACESPIGTDQHTHGALVSACTIQTFVYIAFETLLILLVFLFNFISSQR